MLSINIEWFSDHGEV